jgi:hypothetical protein|tara:strand:+ start:1946 stop:2746 length:801 start_codon:yes stop_codon:yes gene_type:complete
MARNLVTIEQVVNDFVLTLDSDDYVNDVSDIVIKNVALRGIREMGFDMLKRVRSIKLTKNSNDTVTLPDDFVSLIKIGIVGNDGLVSVFGENKHINYSQKYSTDSAGNIIDSDGDGVADRVDSKTGSTGTLGDDDFMTFSNYIFQGGVGQLYGLGGGFYSGQYRLNEDQNRIELSSGAYSEVVIEYIADEARSVNPTIHVEAEEALRSYIYYKLVERKASVPLGEKGRARQEYYNERRRANARLKAFSGEEALKVIRKNFKQAPKY